MSGGEQVEPGTAAAVGAEFLRLFSGTPFEMVRRALEENRDFHAVNAELGEFGRFLDRVISPEIVVDFRGASDVALDQDLIREGHQGWVELWRVFMAPWQDFTVSQELLPLDDSRVIVDATWTLTGEGSGVQLSIPAVGLWMVREGQIVRLAQFDSVEKARAAAALPEWRPAP